MSDSLTTRVRQELVALRVSRGISTERIRRNAPQIQSLSCIEAAERVRPIGRDSTAYEIIQCAVQEVVPGPERRLILAITLNINGEYPEALTDRRAESARRLNVSIQTHARREEEAYWELARVLVVLDDNPCYGPEPMGLDAIARSMVEHPLADQVRFLQPLIAAAITEYLKQIGPEQSELHDFRTQQRLLGESFGTMLSLLQGYTLRFADSQLPERPSNQFASLIFRAMRAGVEESPELKFSKLPRMTPPHLVEYLALLEDQPERGDRILYESKEAQGEKFQALLSEYGVDVLVANSIEYVSELIAGAEVRSAWSSLKW